MSRSRIAEVTAWAGLVVIMRSSPNANRNPWTEVDLPRELSARSSISPSANGMSAPKRPRPVTARSRRCRSLVHSAT